MGGRCKRQTGRGKESKGEHTVSVAASFASTKVFVETLQQIINMAEPNIISPLTSHLSPLTSHLSPLTSHLSPLTSHLSPLTSHLSPLTSHLSPLTSHLSLLRSVHPILSLVSYLLQVGIALKPHSEVVRAGEEGMIDENRLFLRMSKKINR